MPIIKLQEEKLDHWPETETEEVEVDTGNQSDCESILGLWFFGALVVIQTVLNYV